MKIRSLLTPYRLTTAAIVLAAVVASVLVWFLLALSPLSASSEKQEFTVQPGWGGARIATELQDAGLIRSSLAMVIVTNYTNTGDSLKAGTYLLSPSMSTSEIVRAIAAGEALSSDIVITIPEGMNVWEIDALLQRQKLIVPGSFARTWQGKEGMLFPDTYRFGKDIASASDRFSNAQAIGDALREAFISRTERYTNDQIIIASILEKEAKTPEDMQLVSGIIARRMKLGMPLQIDATVGYGWCLRRWLPMSSTANCDVTQAPIATEIKVDGPYNTYARMGLPVAPISNPGLRALGAAAHPKTSDYLFYLSTRDGSQLIYSKTLAEHLRNRSKYLGF